MSSLSRIHLIASKFLRSSGRFVSAAHYHSKDGAYGHNSSCDSNLLDRNNESSFSKTELDNRIRHSKVVQLVEAYRTHGHKIAHLDPLNLMERKPVPELDLNLYGLQDDLGSNVNTEGVFYGSETQHLKIIDLLQKLEKTYSGNIGAEFQHLQTQEERVWFARLFESKDTIQTSPDEKVDLAKLLLRCQAFDHFIATKFATVKRYGGEGGESMMACFDEIFMGCTKHGIENIVMCMPHRGRLNFMTCLLNFPPVIMFRKMKGMTELPPGAQGIGDVLSHLYTSVDLVYNSKNVHLSLIPNPSHLEANNPVSAGKARSKLQTLQSGHYSTNKDAKPGDKVLCLQVHGDASFTGQGVVAETFCFADAPHFSTGGSIHVVVNNQVGFTTEADRGRSSSYCSDIAKMNGYPVIHVNADCPEDVKRATAIAMEYRAKFQRDIVIDLVCFRRWGHNEIDEPAFTQPIMYKVINSRMSIPDLYAQKVVSAGFCEQKDLTEAVQQFNNYLSEHLNEVPSHENKPFHLQDQWSSLVQAGDNITVWDTGVPVESLKFIGSKEQNGDDWRTEASFAIMLWKEKKNAKTKYICASNKCQTKALGEFYHLMAQMQDDDEKFVSYLRMKQDKFDQLLNLVSEDLTKTATNICKLISPEERLFVKKIHPTLQRGHVDKRLKSLTDGKDIDWATAEALAMGSLLCQGFHVRISGQDVGRGTFSHRHCMLVDQETDQIYIPLNNISESQDAFLEVANSALSEEGVLGFEYGFSIDKPTALVIWEAQFGDFFNAAQTIVDTYVTSGECLVMVLPNGMDGAGPEHSSCRIERFLQLCDSKEDKVDGDNVNVQIVNPTTAAQYFHLLRRQMVRNFQKPLIVAGPKTLLRLPAASSTLAEMAPGTHFQPVLADSSTMVAADVKRLVFCSGKHYYALVAERERLAAKHVAFIRLESLCPFPTTEVQAVLKQYPNVSDFVWSQEEHRNMGAWSFVNPRFKNLVGCELRYAGREVLGAPAVGIGELHKKEIESLMTATFS
ncbi:2-oxoglutarate dehydrogenase E1 component [Elysia marginata]|uniref:2-oxoglutarate dehydrogenase E1 component n=1 Tax=Elysia marginata TaxID=1093978 RepID=A0AAV4JX11_9GAST|nr:2-oxoglutarate dehydrogenase E1 component [Elysia marginata]